MNNQRALDMFSEVVRNTKSTTESHRPAFFGKFLKFGHNINRITRQINNEGYRKAYFHIAGLETALREYLNYNLQNQVYEDLKLMELESGGPGVREICLDASTSISIYCLSEEGGRGAIDMKQLRDDLYPHISDVGEEVASHTIFHIAESIRNIYDDFVQKYSDELINFYDLLYQACREGIEKQENKWDPPLRVISQKIIEVDAEAISWKRGERI